MGRQSGFFAPFLMNKELAVWFAAALRDAGSFFAAYPGRRYAPAWAILAAPSGAGMWRCPQMWPSRRSVFICAQLAAASKAAQNDKVVVSEPMQKL